MTDREHRIDTGSPEERVKELQVSNETVKAMNFADFQQAMIAHAKKIQGDNYPGDEYYLQICWREYYDDGDTPEDAVLSDMSYWEPSELEAK